MRINVPLCFIFMMLSFSVRGQIDLVDTSDRKEIVLKRSINLLTGVSVGRRVFGDIGFSKNIFAMGGPHSSAAAWFASTEFSPGNKFILGPKVGIWIAGGMAFGVNMIYYTDFDKGSLAFRPEIGSGFDNFKIVYGYNAVLTKHRLEGINRHLGSIVYCFRLKQLKTKSKTFSNY